MRISRTRGGSRVRWLVGPLAATCALILLGVVWLGLFASGGGLLIAIGVAFWAGWGIAALVDPHRPWLHAIVVAAYLLLLLTAFFVLMQSQPLPPGASRGRANVPAPTR